MYHQPFSPPWKIISDCEIFLIETGQRKYVCCITRARTRPCDRLTLPFWITNVLVRVFVLTAFTSRLRLPLQVFARPSGGSDLEPIPTRHTQRTPHATIIRKWNNLRLPIRDDVFSVCEKDQQITLLCNRLWLMRLISNNPNITLDYDWIRWIRFSSQIVNGGDGFQLN